MQKCILFGNSEHPFPEKQSIPFRSRVQLMISTQAVHALEFSISKGMDPYCSLPALSTYMGHKGIESTEYYLRLTKQYFVNVLNYTQEQADTIFPEV